MDFAVFPSRMAAVCLGVMGLMGAMLSITGIFGMAAYTVSQRLRNWEFELPSARNDAKCYGPH